MTFLSLNVRGFGKVERVRALTKLIYAMNPIIIFLQDTMCPASHALEVMGNILPGWELSSLDPSGFLEGFFPIGTLGLQA